MRDVQVLSSESNVELVGESDNASDLRVFLVTLHWQSLLIYFPSPWHGHRSENTRENQIDYFSQRCEANLIVVIRCEACCTVIMLPSFTFIATCIAMVTGLNTLILVYQ